MPRLGSYKLYTKDSAGKNTDDWYKLKNLLLKGYGKIVKCYLEGKGVEKDLKKAYIYKKRLSEIMYEFR